MIARRESSHVPSPRDQPESAFAAILVKTLGRVPGARSAALVDSEGETVDYAGRGDPYAIRLAAAHWRIVLNAVRTSSFLASTRSLALRCADVSFVIGALPEGYAIVLTLAPWAGRPATWRRALSACACQLGEEAGWASTPYDDAWYAAEVMSDAAQRPSLVEVGWHVEPGEVIGRLLPTELEPRERGWRVRAQRGVEAMLIREPGGFWYIDERLPG